MNSFLRKDKLTQNLFKQVFSLIVLFGFGLFVNNFRWWRVTTYFSACSQIFIIKCQRSFQCWKLEKRECHLVRSSLNLQCLFNDLCLATLGLCELISVSRTYGQTGPGSRVLSPVGIDLINGQSEAILATSSPWRWVEKFTVYRLVL